jgi:hypothetical protein
MISGTKQRGELHSTNLTASAASDHRATGLGPMSAQLVPVVPQPASDISAVPSISKIWRRGARFDQDVKRAVLT